MAVRAGADAVPPAPDLTRVGRRRVTRPAARSVATGRPTRPADVAGVAVVAAAVGLATRVAVHVRGDEVGEWWVLDVLVGALCLVAAVALALVALRVQRVRAEVSPAIVVARIVRVWTRPPGAWVAAATGAIVTLPLWSLHAPILGGDADSARLLSATRYLLDGHGALAYFADTQEPVLPPLLLAPVVVAGGLPYVTFGVILGIQATASVTSFITFRITRSLWAAAAAAASLLCLTAVTERATRIPFYGLMLALGYLGAWYAYRTLTDERFRWGLAVPAALLVVLSQEVHGVGQLFLAAPLLVAVFASDRHVAALRLTRLYGAIALAMLPRVVLNLSVDGFRSVTSPRADYWITEGYVAKLQTEMLGYQGVDEPWLEFLGRLPERFVASLGPTGWGVVVLAVVVAALLLRGRARVFVLAVVTFLALALTVKRVPPFPRYFSHAWPGMAILVGVGVATLGRWARARWTPEAARWLSAGAVAVLAVPALVTVATAGRDAADARELVEDSGTRQIARAVVDDRGVIGARATQAFFTLGTEVPVWGDQFLTEDEYVTYLTWPSDRAVLDVLDRHDIGWVYITDVRQLELDYNDAWLRDAHGRSARHVDAVAASPNFCLVRQVGFKLLYRVGPCPPSSGDGVDEAARGVAPVTSGGESPVTIRSVGGGVGAR